MERRQFRCDAESLCVYDRFTEVKLVLVGQHELITVICILYQCHQHGVVFHDSNSDEQVNFFYSLFICKWDLGALK